jgi:hypothetical protein
MKHTLSALVFSVGLLVPALASAQEIGAKGDAVFSVDRLMGINGVRSVTEEPTGDEVTEATTISFGWRGSSEISPFEVPRFAFDYLVIEHLSIGGSLGYASLAVDEPDNADFTFFEVAPRVGYLYSFGQVVAIWPRGGVTYHSASTDLGDNEDSESGFALTLECPFTFSPTRHFAFHIGPTFDIDMFGEHDPQVGPDEDRRYRSFGLNAGILGWF